MRRFWGRGAVVAGLLLGATTVGSYAAGAHLGVPGRTVAVAASQSPPTTTGANVGATGQRDSGAPLPPGPGRRPRGPRDFRP